MTWHQAIFLKRTEIKPRFPDVCVLVVIYKCTVLNPFNFNAAWNADGESKRTNTLDDILRSVLNLAQTELRSRELGR